MNKVLGICGCGSNVLRYMMKQDTNNLELISIQENPMVFEKSKAHKKILINSELDKKLDKVLQNTSGVFIVFGLAGATGSHYSKFILKAVIDKGLDVKVICIYPFNWEGKERKKIADKTLHSIQELTSNIEVLKNEELLPLGNDNISTGDLFELFDKKIYDITKDN